MFLDHVWCSLVAPAADGAENDEDEIGPPAKLPKVEVQIQERKDTKPGVPYVREWDRGKGTWPDTQMHGRSLSFHLLQCLHLLFLRKCNFPFPEFSWGQWTSLRREERDSDFAPPSAYFADDRWANHNRATDKGQAKGKPAFKWSESQRATERDTENISTPSHPSDMPTYAQPSQPQTAQTQSLDDLLSFYKHSTWTSQKITLEIIGNGRLHQAWCIMSVLSWRYI